MRKLCYVLFFIFTFITYAQTNSEKLSAIKELRRIALGSCNNQYAPQPLWSDMLTQSPDLFIWTGDAVYGDWKSAEALELAFQHQNAQADYLKLKTVVPVIGTWDDHDYGHDNANGNLSYKTETQRLYLDFLEEPLFSKRRIREGVYTSHVFGPSDRKIKIILLDNRYFKDLDPSAPLLGKAQWEWLEAELKGSDASLHFIVAGLSVFSPGIPYTEEWAHYPQERNRMLELIKTHAPKGPVFLTGDKHFSSVFIRYGQLEFMSSGMTHTASRRAWWYLGRKYPTSFFGLNYGLIDIDWDGNTPIITTGMRSTSGRTFHRYKFRWQKDRWKEILVRVR